MFIIKNNKLNFKDGDFELCDISPKIVVADTVLTAKINTVIKCDLSDDFAVVHTGFYDFKLHVEKTKNGYVFKCEVDIIHPIKSTGSFSFDAKIKENPEICVYNTVYGINGSEIFDMDSQAKTEMLVESGKVTGAGYVSYKTKQNNYGVIGSVTYDNYFNTVTVCENGKIMVAVNLNGKCFGQNSALNIDKFCIINSNQSDVLFDYGKLIAESNGVSGEKRKYSGWCSWYYYGGKITEKNLLEDLEILSKRRKDYQVFQIDAGWYRCNGDWEENEKFPHGMKYLCDKIKEKGYIPGIWVAPFDFSEESETHNKHKDWFISSPTYRDCIDFSNKEAQDYLCKLFTKLSKEWGYRYIKIDLISYNIAGSGYENKGFSPLNNYREALKIIKESVTEDTVLLTCTSPIDASVGYADSIRTAIDIFENFNAVKEVAKMVYKRNFVSEFAVVDPDCFMVRTSDKEDSECFRFCTRNETEIRTFRTFIYSVGGTTMISDKLSLLNDKDFEYYASLIPISKHSGVPLDLYDRDYPSVIDMGKNGKYRTIAVINWEDEEKEFTINLGENFGVHLTYRNEDIICGEKTTLRLSAHDSELLYILTE